MCNDRNEALSSCSTEHVLGTVTGRKILLRSEKFPSNTLIVSIYTRQEMKYTQVSDNNDTLNVTQLAFISFLFLFFLLRVFAILV